MAKLNFTKGQVVGNAGAYTYRLQPQGITIMSARTRTNSSRGAGATASQRARRIYWANLINLYKVIRPFLQRAYEGTATAKSGARLSDYNRFIKLNSANNTIALPADYARVGACYAQPYIIAQGSLSQVELQSSGSTNVACSLSGTAFTSATVADLSADLIELNAGFQYGDKLTFGVLVRKNILVGTTSYPTLVARYIELELNATDETTVGDLFGQWSLSVANNVLVLNTQNDGESADALMAVHTRISSNSSALLCSNQTIVMVVASAPSSAEWIQQCMDSYGYTEAVLIQPETRSTSQPVSSRYRLSVSVEGSGAVSMDPAGPMYEPGTVVTVTATPVAGANFLEWSDGVTTATRTVTMDSNVSLTARFSEVGQTYSLLITTVGSGAVSLNPAGGVYAAGTSVVATCTAQSGKDFIEWSDASTENPRTFVMSRDITITATFED